MTDLAYLGIVEASALFAARKLSPVELCLGADRPYRPS